MTMAPERWLTGIPRHTQKRAGSALRAIHLDRRSDSC